MRFLPSKRRCSTHLGIICGFVFLFAHTVLDAQGVPEREVTLSTRDGQLFADFMLEEGEAALIQFRNKQGKPVPGLDIRIDGEGGWYAAGRHKPGTEIYILPKRNPVSVPLFGFPTTRDIKLQLLVKETGERETATIAQSTRIAIPGLPLPRVRIVNIPGGTFRMGDLSNAGDNDEQPTHNVTMAPFELGKTEVTFAQWDFCVADGGCSHRPDGNGFGRGDRPVINVSWNDVQEFIAWLNTRTEGGYRLPTESEWEYAARAGSETEYSWGDDIREDGGIWANCLGSDCGDPWDNTAPVGSFPANARGLHDMHGNVWEWTQDCWNNNYRNAPDDGSAWENGTCNQRVLRGGAWNSYSTALRTANRLNNTRSGRGPNDVGFRLAKSVFSPVKMVRISVGTFDMGDLSGEGNSDEMPVRSSVTVAFFELGKTEVTFAQWDFCVADGGCTHRPDDEGYGRGSHPVINVSWNDVQEFIAWLNARTGGGYRLPSESEWEYAVRAGSETEYSWGDNIREDGGIWANCANFQCADSWNNTAPVGRFESNAWRLHDMHGNVAEWVQDCQNNNYMGAPTDGSAWEGGNCNQRITRGGSWFDTATELRSANRSGIDRSNRAFSLGLRLAKNILPPMEMVRIPGGTFRMGDLNDAGDDDEMPVHNVAVALFELGKTEVTFAQWDFCVVDGGCAHRPDDEDYGRGNRPVINVSWDDVQEFIAWLNTNTNGDYRLPTESEWEYAARAGSVTKYSWGDDIREDDGIWANCLNTFCGDPWDNTAPVGSFPANAWGLHDMHGNVWEWVQDCPNNDYTGAPTDGSAWRSGFCGMTRGGAWSSHPRALRSANRQHISHSIRGDYDRGFRLAKSLLPPIRMVTISSGMFNMGSSKGDNDEKPVHSVMVASFKLGKYEVTFAQWNFCVADGGCSHRPDDNGFGRGDRPVINVSWNDAQEFITWLNRVTDGGYRLPTESEWEYAARAGSVTKYSWGSTIGDNRANCLNADCGDSWNNTAPVGSFPANNERLHDMHGNVAEWVQDCPHSSYTGAPTNGSAWESGTCNQRVTRGGSWGDSSDTLRSANRSKSSLSSRSIHLGLRLARDK